MSDAPKKVGLICGREYSFPPAFIARVNEVGAPHGISAEMVRFAGTRMDDPASYRVIVDRISHEVEYYRGALKQAALQGTYVINNPPTTSTSITRSWRSWAWRSRGLCCCRRKAIRPTST
jgi:hypothetical protein